MIGHGSDKKPQNFDHYQWIRWEGDERRSCHKWPTTTNTTTYKILKGNNTVAQIKSNTHHLHLAGWKTKHQQQQPRYHLQGWTAHADGRHTCVSHHAGKLDWKSIHCNSIHGGLRLVIWQPSFGRSDFVRAREREQRWYSLSSLESSRWVAIKQ